jgi:hypothetical protein
VTLVWMEVRVTVVIVTQTLVVTVIPVRMFSCMRFDVFTAVKIPSQEAF